MIQPSVSVQDEGAACSHRCVSAMTKFTWLRVTSRTSLLVQVSTARVVLPSHPRKCGGDRGVHPRQRLEVESQGIEEPKRPVYGGIGPLTAQGGHPK